jgi:hypothetical protein
LDHLTSPGLAYSQILLARIYEPLVLVSTVISWIRLADLNPCTTCTMYISLTIFLFRSGIAFYFHLFSTVQVTVRPTKKNVCLRSHVKKNLGSVGIHFFFLLSEIVVPESDSGISFSKFPVSRHLLRCNTTKEFSIALYFFICTFYMCSNYNYQNLSGKTSRIIKFSETVSSYTVFEVD